MLVGESFSTVKIIRPQPGPQWDFLACNADIKIYGGQKGSGKSYGMLLDLLRYRNNPLFYSVLFRRTRKQLKNPGGLWDKARQIYPLFAGIENLTELHYQWASGAKIKFDGLQHENDVELHDGAEYAVIAFDELIQFTEKQFWGLVSCNRSVCGLQPYITAATNPSKKSWVKKLIRWWLDADGAYPDYSKSGVLRHFFRESGELIWGDSKEELLHKYPYKKPEHIKSLTFIPARLEDNQILMQVDPGYEGNLDAQTVSEKERLLKGNWNVDQEKGEYFRDYYFPIVKSIPTDLIAVVRYWDRAATEPSQSNPDPDWTAGVLMGKRANGRFIILDRKKDRKKSGAIRQMIKQVAAQDYSLFGSKYKLRGEQEPGASGKTEAEDLIRFLAGFDVKMIRSDENKETRAIPLSSQAEIGNVDMLEGDWNDDFISELEDFPNGSHDDQVDAASGAFNELSGVKNNPLLNWVKKK